MRSAEFGTSNGEEEMAEGECPMANDESQAADGEFPVQEGGCDEGQHRELMMEASSDPVVGHDTQPVIEDATDEGAHTRAANQDRARPGSSWLNPESAPASGSVIPKSRNLNPR